jgi:glutamate-5-semialdehyde dehydrogenase
LPIAKGLLSKSVKLHVDQTCLSALTPHFPTEIQNDRIVLATDSDLVTEYLSLEITIITIPSLSHAIDHINTYGSHHTDVILTSSSSASNTFMTNVDSAGVFWNVSSRFADGFRYGFGAEIGVSTNKVHARGPVGLEGLMVYKYRVYGSGQVVEGWEGKHRDLEMVLPKGE